MIDQLLDTIQTCGRFGLVQINRSSEACSVLTYPIQNIPTNIVLRVLKTENGCRDTYYFTELSLHEATIDSEGNLFCVDTNRMTVRLRLYSRPPLLNHLKNFPYVSAALAVTRKNCLAP